MSGARALIEALKKERVDAIFGIPGGAILPVYDVLFDSEPRHILVRHEQCAAHAADGFARASGRPGVCMATSGPGATNLVTGIANAFMDSSPVVAITGQVPKTMIGRDAFQEADIVGITTPITKYNFQVRKASDIPKTVRTAFHIASMGRPGPVLIDIPKDVQTETDEIEFSDEIELHSYKPNLDPHPIQVKKAVELLVQAEKPVILAGGGITISNASYDLLALAELLSAPVATSLMGKGSFPENHPLSLGMIGMHGTQAANKLIPEADVIFVVGFRFSDRTTGRLDQFCPDASLIHVDIDTAEIGKNAKVDVPIVADAKRSLVAIRQAILQQAAKAPRSTWARRVKEIQEQFKNDVNSNQDCLKPPKLMMELRKILPNDAIMTTEVGQNQMWAALYFKAFQPRTFISSGGLGTMGFGFPAAIGAKVACPDRVVVDVAGDGSYIMTEQELACSVMEKIPVIVIILNNSVLGMPAQWQRLFYDRRYSQVNLGNSPDFVKLAEAYGAQGFRAESMAEFAKAVEKAMKSDVTTVIDVPISAEENVFPMIPLGGGLKDTMWE